MCCCLRVSYVCVRPFVCLCCLLVLSACVLFVWLVAGSCVRLFVCLFCLFVCGCLCVVYLVVCLFCLTAFLSVCVCRGLLVRAAVPLVVC